MNWNNPTDDPFERIEQNAAVRARNMIIGTSGAGKPVHSTVPTTETSSTTDGDGNVQTVHVLLWDVDNWDDPYAIWDTA